VSRWLLLAATTITTGLIAPLVLPILPVADLAGRLPNDVPLAEQVGWPDLVHSVADIWASLPPGQRAHTVILASNYGEAAAINELGRGLPSAVSGHNNEWFWGPGNTDVTTVLAVAPGPHDVTVTEEQAYLSGFFQHVVTEATLHNDAGVHNQEWEGHIYLCTGLRHPWPALWPQLRQYS
jgi:hypothetical protein